MSDQTGAALLDVADSFFTVQARFELDAFRKAAKTIDVVDTYDRIALNRTLGNLAMAERGITTDLLATGKTGDAGDGRLGGGSRGVPPSARGKRWPRWSIPVSALPS